MTAGRPARILYVIDSLGVGGAETLLLDLLDAARARGIAAHVAYFTPGPLEPEVTARAASLTRLGSTGLRDPRALWRAWRLMRHLRPDVVHSHLTKSDLVGQMAARLAGVPLRVLTFHNTDLWRKNPVATAVYRILTRGAQRRIAVSDLVADYIVQTGTASRSAISVIANGVDMRRFGGGTAALDRGLWGAGPQHVLFGIIGRLTAQKDHATFLRAAAVAAQSLPNARFLVIGDGELRAALIRQATAAGLLPDRLTFTGVIRDMPGVLAMLDVVVLSSAWEGLPMTLLEAMSMARPVIATSVGEIPNLIADGVSGLVVPPGDDGALAAAMVRIAGDPALRRDLGAAGRKAVAARYGGDAMIGRLFALYRGDTTI